MDILVGCIGVVLIVRALMASGPEITITFRNAEGLEAGLTPQDMAERAAALIAARDGADLSGTGRVRVLVTGANGFGGPDGIAETNPSADAPYRMASAASSLEEIQQIFTLGRIVVPIEKKNAAHV